MTTTPQNIDQQLKNIVHNAPFPIGVYTGREMNIVLANEAMITTLGKGRNVIGKSYFKLLPELEGQGVFERLLQVMDTGQAYEIKNSRVNLVIDGKLTPHYFNYAFTPLRDSNGEVYGVMNTGADVTELNIARQQVAEAEEKMRLAVHSAELGTYEIDLLNDEVEVSGNFRAIWDIKEPKITKEMLISRLHPDDLQIRTNAFMAIGQDNRISYEARIFHKDKSLHWLRFNGTIIKDSSGNPLTLVGITQDITKQKNSEQALSELVSQRTAELQRSNEDLMQFSRIVSHDLKEPLRKIKTYNQMLRHTEEEERKAFYSTKIDAASTRLSALIDDIHTYSSAKTTGFPVEEISLNTIFDTITKDLELLIDEKKAILSIPTLPILQGAPILLQRLFYNLVYNALKFSKKNEPVRIHITSSNINRDAKTFLQVSIADNGIGIEPTYLERIFGEFERLHSKNEYEGTGLGLALCRKITQRHGGTIRALEKKEGALFVVELPFKQHSTMI